jgi:dTDP-4-dehydrorhamnose reductase
VESDDPKPLNLYGHSKAMAEHLILRQNDEALVIRTSSLFGPWDQHNFVAKTLAQLREDQPVNAAADVFVTPTYVPDLVHATLNLLLDGEKGVFHVTNDEVVSWAQLAATVAMMAGCDAALVKGMTQQQLKWKAKRPAFSALQSEKGQKLPALSHALERYFEAQEHLFRPAKIAV